MGKFIDLTGETFGELVVVERAGSDPYKQAIWRCLCSCGKETLVRGLLLRTGHTKTCGHLRNAPNVRRIPIIGKQFGELTVIEYVGNRGRPGHGFRNMYRCSCSCGKETVAGATSLRFGQTRSCGHLQPAVTAQRQTTHGASKLPEYLCWCAMIARCTNPKTIHYEYYGGRGIKVCDEFRNDIYALIAHIGRRPSREYTIDRIDPNGNYEPGNVRWATRKEQRANQRARHHFRGDRKRNYRVSKEENLLADAMESIALKPERQFAFNHWALDFVFLDQKLVVEVDGTYWHSLPKNIASDERKNVALKEEGWRVLRFACVNVKRDPMACALQVADALAPIAVAAE